jgi:hypothetical protein
MIYILAAAMGMCIARWLSCISLVAVSLVFAIAVGVEGALHLRSFITVLQRGLEVNATLQGAYLAQTFLQVYGPSLFRRSDK